MRAVLLDTTADAAAAIAVALSGAIILATGANYWLDPTVALTVSAIIAYHAIKFLRRHSDPALVIGRSTRAAPMGKTGPEEPRSAGITNNVAHAHANEFSPRVHIMFPRLNLFWSLIGTELSSEIGGSKGAQIRLIEYPLGRYG